VDTDRTDEFEKAGYCNGNGNNNNNGNGNGSCNCMTTDLAVAGRVDASQVTDHVVAGCA
jgi:hypothetical protein